MKKGLLIIGGNGVIGTELVRHLNKDYKITVLDINPCKLKFDDVSYVSGFLDTLKWFSTSHPFDFIINLASVSRPVWAQKEPYMTVKYNTLGCVQALELARRHDAKIIYSSSREVYGDIPESELPAKEESIKRPINIYGTAKLAAEQFCKTYADNYGIDAKVVRLCGVYGSAFDHSTRVIPLFINLALQNEPIPIEGGKQKLAFVHKDDTCEGIKRIMEHNNKKFDDFNLASDQAFSIEEIAKKIITLTGSSSKLEYKSSRSYDVENFWGSFEKAKKLLGWEPKISLEEGLKKTIEIMKAGLST